MKFIYLFKLIALIQFYNSYLFEQISPNICIGSGGQEPDFTYAAHLWLSNRRGLATRSVGHNWPGYILGLLQSTYWKLWCWDTTWLIYNFAAVLMLHLLLLKVILVYKLFYR